MPMRQDVMRSFDRQQTPRDALALWVGDDQQSLASLEFVAESQNFVYRFRDAAGNERYLRITPADRRTRIEIEAEVDFVMYLHAHGYRVASAVKSRAGNWVEMIATPPGEFHVVVFEAIHGKETRWGTDAENRKILFARGKALGRMHRLAQAYKPRENVRRFHWFEDDLFTNPLQYIRPTDSIVHREYETLVQWMLKRPRTPDNYGLVHGDFGSGNTRVADDGGVVIFDFDDCCYHWYLYDLAVAMRAARKLPENYRKAYLRVLVDGYATEMSTNGEGAAEIAMFARLAALYRYISVLRDCEREQFDDQQRAIFEERLKVLQNPPTWY
jgi:Ser/Thr protein kinase RdoA (MazF antagonist)